MTQDEFYKSSAWRRTRKAYIDYRITVDGGLCEVCGDELGRIVHHKKWLNDINCNDPEVALNFSNLKFECQTCHNQETNPESRINNQQGRVRYREDGELIPHEII